MFPLGFNYHVSCRNHPLDKPFWKEEIKRLLGLEHNMFSSTYYIPERFEEIPSSCKIPQVLFLTRLWYTGNDLPQELREERAYINETRIEIIRKLREMEGKIHFVGGLPDTDLAQRMAPDLIMPPSLTDRRNYLKCLHKSDICIGSMGLFESIGWKTGEYVAAAKAIVNERLHYEVPGDFLLEENYLEFETADQCVDAVRYLHDNPDEVMKMKRANRTYYQNFLCPEVLIGNTLELVYKQSVGIMDKKDNEKKLCWLCAIPPNGPKAPWMCWRDRHSSIQEEVIRMKQLRRIKNWVAFRLFWH